MKISYNAGAIAKMFAILAQGSVTEEQFLNAQTPDEVDALIEKAHIDPALVGRVYDLYSEVDYDDKGPLEVRRDDSIGPEFKP